MRTVARERGVVLVDIRDAFRNEGVGFRDICHFGPKGHVLIARELASAVGRLLGSSETAPAELD